MVGCGHVDRGSVFCSSRTSLIDLSLNSGPTMLSPTTTGGVLSLLTNTGGHTIRDTTISVNNTRPTQSHTRRGYYWVRSSKEKLLARNRSRPRFNCRDNLAQGDEENNHAPDSKQARTVRVAGSRMPGSNHMHSGKHTFESCAFCKLLRSVWIGRPECGSC